MSNESRKTLDISRESAIEKQLKKVASPVAGDRGVAGGMDIGEELCGAGGPLGGVEAAGRATLRM